jgi:hypothetical protein
MIRQFEIMPFGGRYLVVAVMEDGPVIEVGVFDDLEEIDEACERFCEDRQRSLH